MENWFIKIRGVSRGAKKILHYIKLLERITKTLYWIYQTIY